MKQFFPGLDQLMNPQTMPQSYGPWAPEQLAQGFQLARGQGATLGNPEAVAQAQAQQQQNLAEMMARYQAEQGRGQFGDALMGTQYVQNSGALGALAQALSMGIGGRVKRLADEKASDYAGRIFAEQQRQDAAKKAEEEAKATRLRNEELARADALRAYEASREDAKLAREDSRWERSFGLQERALGAQLANRGAARPTLADKVAEAEAALGRPLTEQERGAIIGLPGAASAEPPKPLTPDQGTKMALLSNALTAAYDWQDKVITRDESGNASFNDWAARMPGASASLKQALRPKLRAESGATITPEEEEGEVDRYLGGFFSSDSTNIAKAENLPADLENQLRGFGPAGEAEIRRIQAERAARLQSAQPQRSNMGGQGMTRDRQNPPPAAGGWSVRQL